LRRSGTHRPDWTKAYPPLVHPNHVHWPPSLQFGIPFHHPAC
jgi:hypothetical protein